MADYQEYRRRILRKRWRRTFAVAGLLVPDFIYNIGTTVLNGGVSMVIFFFVNKIIFPESEK